MRLSLPKPAAVPPSPPLPRVGLMRYRNPQDIRNDPHYRHIFAIQRPTTSREVWLNLIRFHPGRKGLNAARRLYRTYLARRLAEFFAVIDRLPKGSLCIDLGANVGDISEGLLDRGMRVIAFEPDPATFAALSRRLAGREGVQLLCAAAGTADGRAEIQRPEGWTEHTLKGSPGSSLIHRGKGMDPGTATGVEVLDFAGFLRGLGERVAVVKVDIEGGEWELIPHLAQSGCLDLMDHLFVETHEWMDASRFAQAAEFRQMAAQRKSPHMTFDWV